MSTLKSINVQHPSSATINIVNDSSGNVTVGNNLTVTGTSTLTGNVTAAGTVAMGSSFKRNRLINGNMLIDQRNAGASVTPGSPSYMTDRWQYFGSQASKFTAQQNAGAVTTPVGFPNYLGMTVASSVSIGASDYFVISQAIEGFNFADLGFGTASAKSVTLSFLVYSSLTGTFGGALKNYAQTRSYPFSYTISAANTWTTVSITIAGDTAGTWVGASSAGAAYLQFGLGVGSSLSGTAGAWAGASYSSATGAVSVVGTNGATFYITGVQLEVGTKATPYEMQIYSDQLAQCQRYYQFSSSIAMWGTIKGTADTNRNLTVFYSTAMRASPTLSVTWSTGAATGSDWGGANGFNTYKTVGDTTTQIYVSSWTASAEL